MNSTKKTLKNNGTAKKQPQKLQQGTQSNKGTIFAVVLAAVVVLVSGIIAWENLHPRLIFTLNGEKTYLEDMTYHIMQTEGMYNSIDALYQQLGYQQSYWTMEEDGVSTQDRARKDTVDNAVEMEILYAEAVKNGYEATAEEKEKAAADAKDMLSNMSEEQKEKTGFTEENLTEILTKETVAFRYRQDVIDTFDINDDEIKAGVDKDKLREYKTRAFYVSNTDEEGNELTADQLAERKDALVKEADAAKNTDDWSEVLDSEDESQVVSYEAIDFTKEDEGYDEAITKKAMTMENGEISDVIETEDGYYIIKMVDNNSRARYEEEVESAIAEVENEKFDEEYQNIYKNYDVKINDKELGRVEFGNITM